MKGPQKPLEEVTCFKCGCKGHYANKCPKGHLAFLSQSQNPPPPGGYRRWPAESFRRWPADGYRKIQGGGFRRWSKNRVSKNKYKRTC